MNPDVRLRTYLGMFLGDVFTLMSGALTVPFTAVAVWASRPSQKFLWVCLAILSLVCASYRVWRRERIEKDGDIAKRDDEIKALNHKLKRPPAKQNLYQAAAKVLQKYGPSAADALRHLRANDKLKFGTFYPVLPGGMRGDALHKMYIALAAEGLVSQDNGKIGTGEVTFSIAPPMIDVLDELLYANEDELKIQT
jgi:hypothetical protein